MMFLISFLFFLYLKISPFHENYHVIKNKQIVLTEIDDHG